MLRLKTSKITRREAESTMKWLAPALARKRKAIKNEKMV